MFLVGEKKYWCIHEYWEPNPPWVLNKYQAINPFSSHRDASCAKYVVMEGSLAQDLPPSSKWCDSKLQGKFWVFVSLSFILQHLMDGTVLGIAGRSSYQIRHGSHGLLLQVGQPSTTTWKYHLRFIQAAHWKSLYLLSIKINVILKM